MSHSIRVTCPEPLTIWIRDDGDEDTPSTGYGLFRIGTEGLDHLAGNPDHCDAASAWAIEQGLMEEPPEEPPEADEEDTREEDTDADAPAPVETITDMPDPAPQGGSPLDVRCPRSRCRAPAGSPCRTGTGRPKDDFHKDREDAFARS